MISNYFYGVAFNIGIRQCFLGNSKKPLSKAIISNGFYSVTYNFGFMQASSATFKNRSLKYNKQKFFGITFASACKQHFKTNA